MPIKLGVTNEKTLPDGGVSYDLTVTEDGMILGTVPVTVADPTALNIRAANRAAVLGDVRLRVRIITEKQARDLEAL